jgi:hypothetical protein
VLLLLLAAAARAGHMQHGNLPCELLPAAAPLLTQVQLLVVCGAGRVLHVQLHVPLVFGTGRVLHVQLHVHLVLLLPCTGCLLLLLLLLLWWCCSCSSAGWAPFDKII